MRVTISAEQFCRTKSLLSSFCLISAVAISMYHQEISQLLKRRQNIVYAEEVLGKVEERYMVHYSKSKINFTSRQHFYLRISAYSFLQFSAQVEI